MHFIEKLPYYLDSEAQGNGELLYLWYINCTTYFMKHLYLVILILFVATGYAQDSKPNGDIEGFKLYPNPVTTGKVYIQTKADAPKKVFIFDVLGTKVLQTTILGSELNVADLGAGVYVLRVFEKDKVATRKLIIK